jgi:hypothetical protein
MDFEIIGEIRNIETISASGGIRALRNLNRLFGESRWPKLKGQALIKLSNGHVRLADIHWYEGHGIGKRKFCLWLIHY